MLGLRPVRFRAKRDSLDFAVGCNAGAELGCDEFGLFAPNGSRQTGFYSGRLIGLRGMDCSSETGSRNSTVPARCRLGSTVTVLAPKRTP
jgi:hypothetical protein